MLIDRLLNFIYGLKTEMLIFSRCTGYWVKYNPLLAMITHSAVQSCAHDTTNNDILFIDTSAMLDRTKLFH